jgi:hypothetical protein
MKNSKTALITGASSGIGTEFARQLASQGYNLALVARRQERLASLADRLQKKYSITTEVLVTDLTKEKDLQRLENFIVELEALDLLVNNAGFGMHGKFTELNISKHIEMIQIHNIASLRLTHAALPGMLARNQGGIINVSSISGLVPIGNITYGSTKAFQVVFSETLQMELSGTGIKIQALCPGYTYTEFHDRPDLTGFQRSKIPRALWSSAEEVVAESLRVLKHGKVICIPGRLNRIFVSLGRNSFVSPIVRYLAKRFRSKRYGKP